MPHNLFLRGSLELILFVDGLKILLNMEPTNRQNNNSMVDDLRIYYGNNLGWVMAWINDYTSVHLGTWGLFFIIMMKWSYKLVGKVEFLTLKCFEYQLSYFLSITSWVSLSWIIGYLH